MDEIKDSTLGDLHTMAWMAKNSQGDQGDCREWMAKFIQVHYGWDETRAYAKAGEIMER